MLWAYLYLFGGEGGRGYTYHWWYVCGDTHITVTSERLAFCYRRNPAVTKFQFPRVSPGAHLLTKKPEDSGYEIMYPPTWISHHLQNSRKPNWFNNGTNQWFNKVKVLRINLNFSSFLLNQLLYQIVPDKVGKRHQVDRWCFLLYWKRYEYLIIGN